MNAPSTGISTDIPPLAQGSEQEASAVEISTVGVSLFGAADVLPDSVAANGKENSPSVDINADSTARGLSASLLPAEIAMLLAQSMQYVSDAVKLVHCHNGKFTFHYLNQSAQKLFQDLGFHPETFINKSPTECFSAKFAHAFINEYASVLETKQEKTFTITWQDINGRAQLFRRHLIPMKNNNGDITCIVSMMRDVTEQIYVGKHQQRLALVLENAPGLVMIKDTSSLYYFNPSALHTLGINEQHSQVYKPSDFFTDPNILEAVIFPAVHANDTWRGECMMRTLTGTIFPASVIVMGLRKEDQNIEEYVFICIDRTEQKVERERLLESERLARIIIENVQQYAFVRLDARGTITSWNQGAERIFEYDADAVIGRHVRILEPASQTLGNPSGFIGGFTDSLLDKALDAQEIIYESRRISSSGRLFYTENTLTTLYDHLGRHIGYSLIVHDVSESRRMKEELRRKRRDTDIFVENSSDMILRFNSKKICVFANRMIESIVIASRASITGLSIEDMMAVNSDMDAINYLLERVLETGNEAHGRSNFDTPQGKLTFAVKAIPEFDEQNRLETIVVIATNITTEIAAQELLLKTLAEAKDLQEFKVRFQKVISHELRTPLAGVKMSSDIVERYMESLTQEELLYHTKEINASVREIEMLLDNMLLTMKVETQTLKTDFTRCDIVELCHKEIVNLRRAHRNTRTIEFASSSERLLLLLDKYLVHIILRNILNNAINYSDESSVIHVWAGIQHGSVCITVHDTGIGIIPEDMKAIFQPFFRGKNAENIPGIGMGLFVTQHCVELHQGSLDVQSVFGKETTVMVLLPIIEA